MSALVAGVLLVGNPGIGLAQGMQGLEEIVVTARKREESLQDIPVSVTAIGLGQIERLNITSLSDVARYTAGFNWAEGLSPIDVRPSIRGQSNIRAASQPTVGIFVDGVPVPWRSGLNIQTVDVQRIEVVKGPQSAMFGRGVLSGAVNYVTRRPQDEFGGYAETAFREDGKFEQRIRVDLPLNERAALAVNGRYMDFDDGLYRNQLTGRDGVAAEDARSIALSGLFRPTDSFTAYLRASYGDEYQAQPAYHTVPSNTQTGATANQVWLVGKAATDPKLIAHNCDDCAGVERRVAWLTANLDWDIDYGTLSSLSAWNRSDTLFDLDTDFMGIRDTDEPVNAFGNNFRAFADRDIRSISQELRFTSPEEQPLRWLVGAYYYDEEVDEDGRSILGTTLGPNDVPSIPQTNEVSTVAGFGAIIWDINDRLTANAELRYNVEKAEVDFIFAGQPENLSETWRSWLPRVTLDYRITPDIMLYVNAAKGTKPGGFNTALGAGAVQLPEELLAFDEEEAWSYEIGAKSQWLDRRLLVNAALFYTDWDQVQVDSQFSPPPPATGVVGYTSNAGSARIRGGELEIQYQAMEQLDLALNWAYNPAKITDYQDSRATAAGISTLGERQLPYSSRQAVTASATWNQALSTTWSGFIQTDLQYQSTQYATVANLAETGSRTVVDLRLGVSSDHWELTGIITNLFDDDTALSISPFVNPQTFARNFIVAVPEERLLGVRARYKF